MAANPFLGDALRPDPARAAHLNLGVFSPMWLPFMAAAGVGAAWWTFQNWSRLVSGGVTGGNGSAAGQTGAARNTAEAASVVKSYQPQPAPPAAPAANDASSAQAAPTPAAPATAQVAPSPAASTITESLAVQGDDAAPAPAPKPRAKAPEAAAAPKAERAQAPEAKPGPKKAQAQPAAALPSQDDGQHEHVKPEPELPPHEGLPARKKSGGGKKKG